MSMLDRLRGSKPISPTMVPSKPSGCGIKGMALLFAIMHTDDLEGAGARARGIGAIKAEALARSAVNEATVAFMVVVEWCFRVLGVLKPTLESER